MKETRWSAVVEKPVGVMLLPNYSARPPIMRPRSAGHGNNVGINGAVSVPAAEIIGVRGVLIFVFIDFHILPPTI